MANLQDILNINVDTLKATQYKAIKDHALKVLRDVTKALNEDKLDVCKEHLESSPSGDGYGCDNQFIDFSWKGCPDSCDGYDLGSILEMLEELK